MKNVVLLLLVGVGLFKGYQHYKMASVPPLHETPYVAVYGRDTCGFTQATLARLDEAGVVYEYFDVDDPSVASVLHERMRGQGVSTRRYLLPVVDVNNEIEVRPDNDDLVGEAKALNL